MVIKLGNKIRSAAHGLMIGAGVLLASGTQASADTDISGKKVVFVPIAMGISLTEGWARRMREHADMHGYTIAEDIVKECGEGSGKSGKVSIVPGQLTAADSVIMNEAAFKVFEAHKEIEVVSNQASDWEPEKARQITATVLQQHPDLCAVFGHWDVHTMGAGNAVKDAGLADSVLVYATGGGDDVACKAVEDNVLDRVWSYDADGQGRDAGTMVDLLLQGASGADGAMMSVESPMKIIKGGDAYDPGLCWKM